MGKSNVQLNFQVGLRGVGGEGGGAGHGCGWEWWGRADAGRRRPHPAPRAATLLPAITFRYVMPAFAGRLVSMDLMMYTPDKMMSDKSPLPISAPGPCFPGRYSPTYRSPDPMRRCMPNPPVSSLLADNGLCDSDSVCKQSDTVDKQPLRHTTTHVFYSDVSILLWICVYGRLLRQAQHRFCHVKTELTGSIASSLNTTASQIFQIMQLDIIVSIQKKVYTFFRNI